MEQEETLLPNGRVASKVGGSHKLVKVSVGVHHDDSNGHIQAHNDEEAEYHVKSHTLTITSKDTKSTMEIQLNNPYFYGSQAIVYLCKSDDVKLACKMPRTQTRSMFDTSLREAQALRQLQHDHIVRYRTHFIHNDVVNIVLSPLASCSLQTMLSSVHTSDASDYCLRLWTSHLNLGNKLAGNILQDTWPFKLWLNQQASCLASALDYLHGLKIRHGDIRPDNIILHQSKLMFCDFGDVKDFKTIDPPVEGNRVLEYFAEDVFTLGAAYIQMVSAFDMLLDRKSWGLRHVIDGRFTYYDNYWRVRGVLGVWIGAMVQEVKLDGQSQILGLDSAEEHRVLHWLQVMWEIMVENKLTAGQVFERLDS